MAKDNKHMGKTITTYLIDGDPKGTQYVFICNKICQISTTTTAGLYGKTKMGKH